MSAAAGTRRILVVDDDPEIRDCLLEVLGDEGYAATGASDGRAALDHLASANPLPDLIVLDLLMPVMDGAEFRAEQLKDPRLAAVPTVIVSANARVRETAAQLGVAAWMRKPIDLIALLDLVRAQIDARGG